MMVIGLPVGFFRTVRGYKGSGMEWHDIKTGKKAPFRHAARLYVSEQRIISSRPPRTIWDGRTNKD